MSAKKVRVWVTLSAVIAWVAMIVVGIAREPGDWSIALAGLFVGALCLAPFAVYYFGITSTEFSILIGGGLILLTGGSLFLAYSSTSSTAGLAALWIPVIGFPLALVGVFLDRMSR